MPTYAVLALRQHHANAAETPANGAQMLAKHSPTLAKHRARTAHHAARTPLKTLSMHVRHNGAPKRAASGVIMVSLICLVG